jgi:hypothetical protein
MRPTIEAFFRPGWRHKRIDLELAKMVGTSIKRKEAASKAGTVSSIKRANGTSTSRARNVHAASTERARDVNAAYTPRAPDVHHSTQERLTTTSRDTARATPNQPNPPETEPNEPKSQAANPVATPQGFAMEARKAVQNASGSIGSGALFATNVARGWVKP